MKIIKGDLIMESDMTFKEDLKVEGNISVKDGERFSLIVKGNINARDINAWSIDAWNIDARDINARDINAGDISYYAVCFAYNNIKCKSIKGRRKNAKHFVLDGKIEIIDEVKKEINQKQESK